MSRKIANKIEDLPKLKKDYCRVVHLTKFPESYLASIIKEGLKYNYGMLSATARWWGNEKEVDYFSDDFRFSGEGTHAVVMDVPNDEIRLHDNISKSPGIVPKKYLVGIIDVSDKGKKLEGILKPLSVFAIASSILIVSTNITGNAVANLTKTYSNILGAIIFLLGLLGLFYSIKK